MELYTQEVDEETHNIVQVYFSDLRDEVAVDVLNLTGTDVSLEDAECITFDADATGAALNYKIIVRDGRVVAVLYQEGGEVRHSPFIEHALPPPGSFVTLADGALGILQALPRGLVVARTPRELPELDLSAVRVASEVFEERTDGGGTKGWSKPRLFFSMNAGATNGRRCAQSWSAGQGLLATITSSGMLVVLEHKEGAAEPKAVLSMQVPARPRPPPGFVQPPTAGR